MYVWWFFWPLLLVFLFWAVASTWWPGPRWRGNGPSEPWGDGSRPFPTQRGLWRSPPRSSNRGRGPAGYRRSDERITEDINDALMVNDDLDASGIAVSVSNGVAVLTGFVRSRGDKRLAEILTDGVAGVDDVKNELRIGGAPPGRALPVEAGQARPAEPPSAG